MTVPASRAPMRERAGPWIASIHDDLTALFERLDAGTRFTEDRWDRAGGGGGVTRVLGMRLSVRGIEMLEARTWLFLALALLFPAVRRFFKGVPGSAGGYFAGAWIAALLLALGPVVTVGGKAIGNGPYVYLYEWVPGFNGMRVPGRFTMMPSAMSTCTVLVLAGPGMNFTVFGSRGSVTSITLQPGTL